MTENIQKAIIWLEKMYEQSISYWENDGTGEGELVKISIIALKQMQRWINVEDKLPEVYQYETGEPIEFNAVIKDAEISTTLCFNGSKWVAWDDEYNHTYEVTHWMLLPEPPKGNKNNG